MRQNVMNFKITEDYTFSLELGLSAIETACFFLWPLMSLCMEGLSVEPSDS